MRGLYCSSRAIAVSGSSPSNEAYIRPITPCSDVNSITIAVTRSVLERIAARCAFSETRGPKWARREISPDKSSRRNDFSYMFPSCACQTTDFNRSSRCSCEMHLSSLKKKEASSRRALRTRSLPMRMASTWVVSPLCTTRKAGAGSPPSRSKGK